MLPAPAGAAAAPSASDPIAGFYRGDRPRAATLEVRREDGGRYAVRLEGGSLPEAGAAAPAGCAIEARGAVGSDGALRARFGPVETGTFSYGAADAARESRALVIVFGAGGWPR